jgi:hypothetical protein
MILVLRYDYILATCLCRLSDIFLIYHKLEMHHIIQNKINSNQLSKIVFI